MSNIKEIFLDMCEDAAFQHEMGVKASTFKQNMAYLAETRGISMSRSIDLANTFKLSIDSLIRRNAEVNKLTVAQEFLAITAK